MWSVLQLFQAFLVAVLAAWLTSFFALHRFRREKVWDRKAAAYTAIFEALFNMGNWFDRHMDALERNHEIPSEMQASMTQEYQVAKTSLQRRLVGESWLLPEQPRLLLENLIDDLRMSDVTDWFQVLDHGQYLIAECSSKLRGLVRRDLSLEDRQRLLPGMPRAWLP